MSHIAHPDVHTHGLHNGCAECGAAAEEPFAFLDDEMLANLVRRVVGDAAARSTVEAIAMTQIRDALNRFARLAKVEPAALAWLPRWGITTAGAGLAAVQAAAAAEKPSESVGTA